MKETIDIYDARVAAGFIGAWYGQFGRIDEYLRKAKLDEMKDYIHALPGFSMSDKIFKNFDMTPEEMDISLVEMNSNEFHLLLNMVTSHAIEKSIPGRLMNVVVWENKTNTILGFIRLGSPVINLKPRNEWLGQPLDSKNKAMMARFNDSSIMGFIIVPVQPFGYNCLGGKLLAGLCCSHEIRQMWMDKYGGEICHFETTSLYGSTKSVSQYDGMKPYLRYKGITESDFLPMMVGNGWSQIHKMMRKAYGDELAPKNATSRKMKIQAKIFSLISNTLLSEGAAGEYESFKEVLEDAKSLTEKKRVYFSDYGFSNTREYLNLETDTLEKKENFARHSMENVIEWWSGKAMKRFHSLRQEGRYRTKLELWNKNPDEIDIIR